MRLNFRSSVLALLIVSAGGCGSMPASSPSTSSSTNATTTSTSSTTKAPAGPTSNNTTRDPGNAPTNSTPTATAGKTNNSAGAVKSTVDRSASSDEARGFETRYARFEPADFKDVPDWQKDRVRDAWLAFLRGCKTLTAKQLWAKTCAQSAEVSANDDAAIRRFIEQQFMLYQVLDPRGEGDGIITGYYEPLLRGNRVADEKFRYPVYSVPGDLLYLDSSRIPKSYPKQRVYARVEGRTVVPVPAATTPAPGLYPIEAGTIGSDIRDRRVRVRLDHNRIVRYYSRSEIETTRLPAARVLVWVDDPIMLYTMQVQGAGKVQLPDGKLVRLGFAEQNGYPFRSKVKRVAYQDKPATGKLRGGANATVPAEETDEADDPDEDSVDAEMEFSNTVGLTRSLKIKREGPPPTREQLAARQAHDPSYVFFRELADSPDGPIGALGVPLTAGRSVAVDPRITPLGAPLYLSTTDPQTSGSLNKLVVAQDTGGAIRGALRADYFFGFGPNAGALANRMKSEGRLWLLLPKSFRPSPMMVAGRTRGSAPVDCVVADPEYCADAGGEAVNSTAQQ